MSQVLECKQLHGQGVPIREISRQTGMSRNTARRYLRGLGTPGVYTMSAARAQPAQAKIRAQVVSILEAEKRSDAPKKQRLTAARIQRLLGAEGAQVSLRMVQQVVREVRFEQRDQLKHAYLPLAVFALPLSHRRLLRTSNMLERLNREIKRRTRVATLFPNEESLLRLATAILVEVSEEWATGRIYIRMDQA